MNPKMLKKLIIGVVIVVVAAVLVFSSFTVLNPTERGVKVTMGKAGDTVLNPGVQFKAPFFQSVRKYDLSPKALNMTFSMGQDAAVTSDMQSVACELVAYWTYDETRILDIVNGYADSTIKSLVRDNTLGAIKEVIGKYSIYDIVEKQEEVTEKVRTSLISRLANYPVVISSLTINNWDWSAEFDAQIANTMKMAQQVKVAQQELEVTKQQAQKQVAEANAAKEKAEIEAQMRVVVAEQEALAREKTATGQANAAKINADAEAYEAKVAADAEAYAREVEGKAEAAYYSELNKYAEIIETLRKLDIESERAERWNGAEVSQYIPLTAAGGLVTIK
jgi:regulator of protease activity HflC (stomatin/prohibitin superfamily)